MLNRLFTDDVALLAVIDPDAYTTQAITTSYVDASKFQNLGVLVSAGDIASSGTIDCQLVQATSSTGAGSKNITGKAITQLTAGSTDSNKQAWINVDGGELDVENSFRYVAATMTVSVAAADSAAYIFGSNPNYGPASNNDVSTVDEIVS